MDRVDLFIRAAGAAICALWGGLIPMVQLLLLLMLIDILSGVAVAIQERKVSSDVAWRGMTRKAVILLIVATAGAVETYAAPTIGNVPVQLAVAGFYAAAEVLSILENAANAGVPTPKLLRDILVKVSPGEQPPEGQTSDG